MSFASLHNLQTSYAMKKNTLTYAIIGGFLIFSTILLVSCNSSADNQVPVEEGKTAGMDTVTAQSNTDTNLLPQAVPIVEKTNILPQIVTPKPVVKKSPITTKANAAKQKSEGETPPANVAESKTPVVAPAVSTSTPEAETKPAPTVSTPKSPKVAHVTFTLKSVKAVIKGSSSLHDWESAITQMEGKGSFETKDDALVAIKDVVIKIAVKGIKSTEGKKMDNKTYETFKADNNPYITYTFSNAIVKTNASNMVTIEAPGKLTMAGNTLSTPLSATGKKLPNGDLQLSFSKKLKMTDFKMEPPVMLLGTIKVGDGITVDFDFVLERTK